MAKEMKVEGCRPVFYSGAVGLSEDLVLYDGGIPFCRATDTDFLTGRSREALADRMIELWTRFRLEETCPVDKKGS